MLSCLVWVFFPMNNTFFFHERIFQAICSCPVEYFSLFFLWLTLSKKKKKNYLEGAILCLSKNKASVSYPKMRREQTTMRSENIAIGVRRFQLEWQVCLNQDRA